MSWEFIIGPQAMNVGNLLVRENPTSYVKNVVEIVGRSDRDSYFYGIVCD